SGDCVDIGRCALRRGSGSAGGRGLPHGNSGRVVAGNVLARGDLWGVAGVVFNQGEGDGEKMRLSNKKAIIIPGAAGIGRAAALAFAREGARVIATDINAEQLATLATAHHAISTDILDVTNRAAVETMAQRIPRVDILLNAAGFVHNGTILDCSE